MQALSRRIIPLLIIGAIAVVFVLEFGPASRGWSARDETGTTTVAATVNGKEIPAQAFHREYAQQLEMFRRQGYSLDENQARSLGIPRSLMNRLVDTELMAQAGEKHGVAASDQEIASELHKIPLFQKNGIFDMPTYESMVRSQLRYPSVIAFEADLRKQLTAQKMGHVVRSSATVSDEELKARYFREGNKAAATVVRFLPSQFSSQVKAPTDAEVKAWAEQHGKEISDYYAANAFLYKQPEEVHARHILVKADREATAEQKAAAKQKAEELRKQVTEGGKDFAQVARDSSEDVGSKVSGGDLGFNRRENWVPEFANAAFALKAGEISQVVESPFGYHVIKVEAKREASEKKLEDVTPEIARTLLVREKAKELARAAAEKALADAKSGKPLAELYPAPKADEKDAHAGEGASGPQAVQTGTFSSQGGAVPQVGNAPELSQAIFAAEGPKLLEQVFPAGEGFAVAAVTERQRPSEENFAEQKNKLREDAVRAKQFELEQAFLEALREKGDVQINQSLVGQPS